MAIGALAGVGRADEHQRRAVDDAEDRLAAHDDVRIDEHEDIALRLPGAEVARVVRAGPFRRLIDAAPVLFRDRDGVVRRVVIDDDDLVVPVVGASDGAQARV